jgi:SAM-dependent methyltransferase
MRLASHLRRWLARPPSPAPGPEPPLSLPFPDQQAWLDHLRDHAEQEAARHRLQRDVPGAVGAEGWPGWCGLCRQPSRFTLPSLASGGAANLREEMTCPGCGLIARKRAALALLAQGITLDTARVYLTEQASAAYVWLQGRCPRVQGSEYGLDDAARRRLQDWYERLGGRGALVERDVTALDFADGSLDAIASFDVLEHVPDYEAALREFARCLRPGGRLVLTVPFREDCARLLVRARLGADGAVEHLMEPEMHGDPVSGGVLCFYHFAWDLPDAVRAAGFRSAAWTCTWSPREGLFGVWTLVASR